MRTFQRVFFICAVVGAVALGGDFGGARETSKVVANTVGTVRSFIASPFTAPPDSALQSKVAVGSPTALMQTGGDVAPNDVPATDAAPGAPTELSSRPTVNGRSSATTDPDTAVIVGQASVPPPFHRIGDLPAPTVAAQAALVADLSSGDVFFDLNADRRWPTASIAKLLTAVEAVRRLPSDVAITIDTVDFSPQEATSAKPLAIGSVYTAQDLLRAMLTISSNEAAEALAHAYGNERFMVEVNGLAHEWQLDSTYLSDSTGLSSADQSTTRDLLRLAQHLYSEYPDILRMTRAPHATITDLQSKKRQVFTNINQFAGNADFVGGKTGYTDEAGGNLLSIFNYDRRPLAIIVLGTDDRFGETTKLYNWFRATFNAVR